MEASEIKVGKIYKDSNNLTYKIIEISETKRPERIYQPFGGAPDGPGVIYSRHGVEQYDFLFTFAQKMVSEIEHQRFSYEN